MSAAEKLKSLQATLETDNMDEWEGAMIDLAEAMSAALPQIVAVVEAAEIVGECYDALEEDGYGYLGDAVRAALAALDEALK